LVTCAIVFIAHFFNTIILSRSKRKFILAASLIAIISGSAVVFLPPLMNEKEAEIITKDTVPVKPPWVEYGFYLDTFHVVVDTVKPGLTLSHLLLPHQISQQEINTADHLARDSADMKFVTEGTRYLILKNRRDTSETFYCVYDKSRIDYVVFDFRDSVCVKRVQRPVAVVEKELDGVIEKNSNLILTIKNSLSSEAVAGELAENVAQIFAWTIDFFKLFPDDKFKIIYEEKQVEGEPYGIGKVKAIWFYNISQQYYAFRFDQDGEVGYYDENGKGMKRPFLQAPLKFSRITSGFSLRRFHPVQKTWKAHLGTDYGAPTGTPIMSVGDGVIEAAGYAQYNGNYVKVKHNSTYQTAYLHMSKIENGIRPGVKVKQGDIIGYVGQTGLATGPHVCYRFWKNGQQIDPKGEKFQATEPVKEKNKPVYDSIMKPLKERLDKIGNSES
jgi:murein DD-endopeptidase MepM/ murein hydrolase activator NlpD